MIGFLVANKVRLLVYAVVIASVLTTVWFHGRFSGEAKLHEYVGKQAVEEAKIVVLQGKTTERVVTKYIKVAGETKVKIEYRDREVVRYVDAKLDQCPVSAAFVSLHDYSAKNEVPDPARTTDGAPSGFTAAQVLPVVAQNYSTCHETANRLRALQEWVREQEKVTSE